VSFHTQDDFTARYDKGYKYPFIEIDLLRITARTAVSSTESWTDGQLHLIYVFANKHYHNLIAPIYNYYYIQSMIICCPRFIDRVSQENFACV